MLNLLIFIIIISIFFVITHINTNCNLFLVKVITLSGLVFLLSSILFVFFDKSTYMPQFPGRLEYQPYFYSHLIQPMGSTSIDYGIDGLSLFFVILTFLLVFLCLLDVWSSNITLYKLNEFILAFIVLELFLVIAFITLDLLVFFIFFESVLIPMFLIIGVWGSRERKIRADFYFFIYTLVGSVMLFFSILVLFSETFSTKFYILYSLFLSYDKECFLFVLSFLAFSVKVPMFPFHVWLPEAHVEAPTSGSVILAGLLLKLGAYGCIRILLPIYPIASNYFFPVISLFCVLSVIYASLTAIRQTDLKRIIAYSSVAHMNVVLIGVFSCNIYGIQGSVFLMLSHGVVSSALFFMVGILYRQHSTRLLNYYGGLSSKMPLFSTYLVLFCLANVGTPGSCNFIGELLIFVSLVDKNFFVLVVTMLSVVLSVSYTLWFFNRLVFGTVNTNFITDWSDITLKDHFILIVLLIITLFFGILPNQVLDTTYTTSFFLVELIKFKSVIF